MCRFYLLGGLGAGLAALYAALKYRIRLLDGVVDAGVAVHLHEIALGSSEARAYLTYVAHNHVHFRVFDYEIACRLAKVRQQPNNEGDCQMQRDAVWKLLDVCLNTEGYDRGSLR